MNKRRLLSFVALAIMLMAPTAASAGSAPVLRVCADPNNLPYSNAAGEGFENRLAELVAQSLGTSVEYTWWAQRRGFIRNTLKAGKCDVVMGIPSGFDEALTTNPYYRSSYVLVYRKDSSYNLDSLSDPLLGQLKVGLHLVGEGISPPAEVLARHGVVRNVVGYSIFGDYSQPNPPARLIDAVAQGDIDVAVAWGPLAGYFAQRNGNTLEVVPLPQSGDPNLPFQFSISMGVSPNKAELRDKLDAVLEQKRPEIHALLKQFGVPTVDDQLTTARK